MKEAENMSYAEAIAELESIMNTLRSDKCDVDSLVSLTRRATELIASCRARLTTTAADLQSALAKLESAE